MYASNYHHTSPRTLLCKASRKMLLLSVSNNWGEFMYIAGMYFQKFLNEELKNRCLKNPNYSLRSFAKTLGYDPSNLSKYLSGQQKISNRFFLNVKKILKLKENSLTEFERENAHLFNQQNAFSITQFEEIGQFQHLTVYEALNLTSIETTAKNLAKLTKTDEKIVESILQSLEKLGAIAQTRGEWKPTSQILKGVFKPRDKSPEDQISLFYKEVLNKMLISLNHSAEAKHYVSFIATNSSLIPEVQNKLKSYREELLTWLESASEKDVVLNIGFSIFPIVESEL
jgi:transcriptional regulator with XRE-family HTH domain